MFVSVPNADLQLSTHDFPRMPRPQRTVMSGEPTAKKKRNQNSRQEAGAIRLRLRLTDLNVCPPRRVEPPARPDVNSPIFVGPMTQNLKSSQWLLPRIAGRNTALVELTL